MDIREQIAGIVEQLAYVPLPDDPNQATRTPTFVYGRKSEINITADNAAFPVVALIEPDQMGFNVSQTTGAVRDTYRLFIQFVDIVNPMGEQANYRHPTVEAMRSLAAQFLQVLSQSDIFLNLPVNINGMLVVEAYDANVAGIEINLPDITDIYPRPC